ncbi:MAG: RDD family protein [Firmicutes bacterium]|nr:RDD family protein [Bacillota bacterium]
MVQQKAPLDKRITAFVIDWIGLCIIQSIIIGTILLPNLKFISPQILITAVITATAITFLINLFKDSIGGMSLGKRIMRIGIRREDNSAQVPSLAKLMIRNFLVLLWPIEAWLLVKNGKRLGDTVTKTDVYSL